MRQASIAEWRPDKHRADPVAQFVHSHDRRIAPLIPLRVERMAASPTGFSVAQRW
jgi:hypothetical protein